MCPSSVGIMQGFIQFVDLTLSGAWTQRGGYWLHRLARFFHSVVRSIPQVGAGTHLQTTASLLIKHFIMRLYAYRCLTIVSSVVSLRIDLSTYGPPHSRLVPLLGLPCAGGSPCRQDRIYRSARSVGVQGPSCR